VLRGSHGDVAGARRGKVLCAFELGDDETEIDGLPVALRPLVRQCSDEGADLVALGAAMVEAFTGVAFGPEALTGADLCVWTPPPSDLSQDTAEYSALSSGNQELHAAIVALSATAQRTLAEWVTEAAVAEAGVDAEPAVMAVTSQFHRDEPTQMMAAAEALAASSGGEHLCQPATLGRRSVAVHRAPRPVDRGGALRLPARPSGPRTAATHHPEPATGRGSDAVGLDAQ